MTSLISFVVTITIAIVVATAPRAALASDKSEAKAHVANAVRAHKAGHFAEARAELEAAYALDPQPDLLYAIGQVLSKLGDCDAATASFERFAATQSDPDVANVVKQAIAACKPVAEPTSGAIAEGSKSSSNVAMPEGPPQAVSAPRDQPVVAAVGQSSPWYHDKLGDAFVLGGVAATAIGFIVYRQAVSDLDAAEQTATSLDRYHELVDRAHNRRATSVVFVGTGGALIAAGIVHYVLRSTDSAATGIAIAPAGNGGVITYARRF